MSTNIPDGAAGPLASVVSGIANSVAADSGVSANQPAGQIASDMARNVASGIDQIFKAVFESLQKQRAQEVVSPPAFSASEADEADLGVDIGTLKSRIDEMRSEASRLMQSENKFDRLRGKSELEVAVELFSLLSLMLEQQMQIQGHGIKHVPR